MQLVYIASNHATFDQFELNQDNNVVTQAYKAFYRLCIHFFASLKRASINFPKNFCIPFRNSEDQNQSRKLIRFHQKCLENNYCITRYSMTNPISVTGLHVVHEYRIMMLLYYKLLEVGRLRNNTPTIPVHSSRITTRCIVTLRDTHWQWFSTANYSFMQLHVCSTFPLKIARNCLHSLTIRAIRAIRAIRHNAFDRDIKNCTRMIDSKNTKLFFAPLLVRNDDGIGHGQTTTSISPVVLQLKLLLSRHQQHVSGRQLHLHWLLCIGRATGDAIRSSANTNR